MKLSKEEFEEVLMEAAHHTSTISGGRCVEIHDAFINKTLEIEGYERSQWVKFDPDDPKTSPACNYEWFLIAAQKSLEPPTFTVMPECATETLLEEIRNDIIKFKLNVYWRPLPKPPVETEAKK